MSHAHSYEYLSLDDYLEGEREVDVRSEYVDGQVYAMVGSSELHNTVATSLCNAIERTLPDNCRVWQSDMKVRVDLGNRHFVYYPDIMAACGENRGDPYVRDNPILIVEVLSPSTKRADLKEKFDNYIQIPSLQEYVVVSQDTPHPRIFRRRNGWQPEGFYAGERFRLESVGLEMAVEEVYRRVRREVGLEPASWLRNRD